MRWWVILGLALMSCWQWGDAQEYEPYRPVPRDVINIVVLNDQSLSGEQVVDPDGYIRLPLVSAAKAAGLTLDELMEKLQQAFGRFIRRPRITVTLKQFPVSVRQVYVLGDVVLVEPMVLRATLVSPVRKLGSFLLHVGSTAVNLLAKGREIIPNADLAGAYPLRKGGSRPVDLLSLLWKSEMEMNLEPQDGDVLFIPAIREVGAVLKPGAVRLQEGDTVLTALSNASGPIPDAWLDEARLIRFVNGSAIVTKLDLGKALSRGDSSQTPVMQPGDVLYISPP